MPCVVQREGGDPIVHTLLACLCAWVHGAHACVGVLACLHTCVFACMRDHARVCVSVCAARMIACIRA